MVSLTEKALKFATAAHAGQYRKYTGEEYINHPIRVADIVSTVSGFTENMFAAALLHDVVEDCDVSLNTLAVEFDYPVASLVFSLTDPKSDKNRAARCMEARVRLAGAHWAAQTIKLADLIDNTTSIKEHDPKFWATYRVEKLMLLGAMSNGDQTLWDKAFRLCTS